MTVKRPITGRTVLFGMLAFFGVIFAVNGAFVYFALDSWPGLRYDHAYERGLKYNEVLDEAKAQAAKGWKTDVGLLAKGNGGELRVRILDAAGAAIPGLAVTARLSRPTNEHGDKTLDLAATPDGRYAVATGALEAGRWQIELVARQGGHQVYKIIHETTYTP